MKTNYYISKIKHENLFIKFIMKFIIVFLLLNGITIFTKAQDNSRKDKIESMKVSYITQKLDLTSKEAQIFWPIYNEYQDKLQAIRKAKRKDVQATRGDIDAMPDSEVESIIDAEIQAKKSEAELAKEYHIKFKQILSIKKVAKLYRAEEDFKRELLNQIKTNNK